MLRADQVQQVSLLPRVVSDVLAETVAQGCSTSPYSRSTYAWALHRQNLLLWKAEDGLAAVVRRLELPEAPVGRTFVEVVPQRQSSALTVIVCTGAGQLYVWLDATFLGKPFSQQLVTSSTDRGSDRVICALAASPADASASPGFLAVVATADGALHLYHGSQSGIFPRQFYHPSSAHGSRGVIDMLGTAVKAVYDGQIFAGSNLLRAGASTTAALQLQLLQLDSSRWKLLVLTADALDCWLLGTLSGKQSTEQLLWSYSVYQAVRGRQRVVDSQVLAFTASTAGGQQQQQQLGPGQHDAATSSTSDDASASQEVIYVWSATMAESTVRYQHACSAFAVDGGPVRGPRLLCSQPVGAAAALPKPHADLHGWQLVASNEQPCCLMRSPNGVLLEWQRGDEAVPNLLSSSSDNLAIACSQASSCWQVLNASYGLLEFSTDGFQAARQPPLDAARALLSRVVHMMHEEYAAGYACRGLATGLAECLSELGVLKSQEGASLLVAISRSLVDNLPKAGTLSSDDLRTMLSDKQLRHSLLLLALQVGGVLRQLPAGVLAALFEHAQMLAAAVEVLRWQRDCEAAAQGNDAAQPVDKKQAEASGRAIAAAGRRAAAGDGELGAAAHQQVEVFFGRPTVSMPALFQAVADAAADVRRAAAGAPEHSGSVGELLQQLLGMCGLLVTAAGAADTMQQQLKRDIFNEVSRAETAGPGWLAAAGPCAAWSQLAEACLVLLPLLSDLEQQMQLSHVTHLPALSHLLAAVRATLQSTADPPADMLQAYQELPWRHGQQLLHVAQDELPTLQARGLLDVSPEELQDSTDVLALLPGLRETLVWPLQTLAQEHRCWELLYATCELISSINPALEGQLQQHMRLERAASNNMLTRDGFTFYVMERWHSQHLITDLLQLGRESFTPQLQQYLADYPDLLWMSQVQAKQYTAATDSLSRAATSAASGESRQLWCLAKLAAKAAGPRAGNSPQLMARSSMRLRQLQLQEQLMPAHGDGEPAWQSEALADMALQAARQQPAPPPAAADGAQAAAALTGADAAVAAVEVLALDASDHQSDSFRQLWDSSWLAVLHSTPLQELAAEKAAMAQGGWTSDVYQDAVQRCPLFRAVVVTAAALQDAAQVVPAINPAAELQKAAAGLMPQVNDPAQQEVFADVVTAAAAVAGMST